MKPKKKYHPKPIRIDNMAFVKAGIQSFEQLAAGVTLRVKNHDSLNNLRMGIATRSDMDLLIAASNIAEAMRRMGKGNDWRAELRAGHDALLAVARRGAGTLHFIMTGLELQALNLLMEIHDAQLDSCTVQDVEHAIDLVTEELKHKRATRIKEKV
tara:strand:+ start:4060 stop:4527 length:468 start_codon:yes stop_codon:yes gene_type:complete